MSLKCGDIIHIMEKLAPKELAESWDNVGLNVGDKNSEIKKILIALDATSLVIDEAIEKNANMIITHHPLILFNDLKNINPDSPIGEKIYKLIKNNISVYCAHTNLDIAFGGTNDILADLIGLENIEILEITKNENLFKFVVYVPKTYVDKIYEAIKVADGGHTGNYSECTFSTNGKGRFKPLKGTNPFIGKTENLETVDEVRVETIISKNKLKNLISEIKKVHPYEEIAYDIYKLENEGDFYGIGRIGNLKENIKFVEFAKILKEKLGLDFIRIVGNKDKTIKRVGLCTGAGSEFFDTAKYKGADCYITGDLKFHEAQKALDMGLCVIDATHYATENLIVPVLGKYLQNQIKDIDIILSSVDGQVFKNV